MQPLPRPRALAISGLVRNMLPARLSLLLADDLPNRPTLMPTMLPQAVMPLPNHHAVETDALFTAMQMLLSDVSSALGRSELPPSSLNARLTMLELLPTRLSQSESNHVWSLSLVLLEVPPSLLMLLLSDARQ